MPLDPGLTASIDLVVGDTDTALAFGSGDVAVLATPRLIALCEQAAIEALHGQIAAGSSTVGLSIQFDHLRPTAVGRSVTAEATLDKVDGRRLHFTISVRDDRGLLGAGKVTRVLVDRERFMEKTL